MIEEGPDVLYKIISALWVLITCAFWYDKRRNDKVVEKQNERIGHLEESVTKHSSEFVTDPRTREIIREEVESIKTDIASTKETVNKLHGITTDLVAEIRVMNAVQKIIQNQDNRKE